MQPTESRGSNRCTSRARIWTAPTGRWPR